MKQTKRKTKKTEETFPIGADDFYGHDIEDDCFRMEKPKTFAEFMTWILFILFLPVILVLFVIAIPIILITVLIMQISESMDKLNDRLNDNEQTK
jgi:preprotein translocase subunit SecG